jgi:hypothetical protein
MPGSILALMPSSLSRHSGYRGRPYRWHAALNRLAAGACCSRWRSPAAAAAFPSARQHACEKGRGQGRLDRNAPVGRAQAGRRDAGRGRPRHCARRGERGPDQGGQAHQPALGEPEDRRPWHGHAARLDLPTGRHHLRDFLASYVKNGSESWLQGEACRAERGKWEVRNLRPRSST